jgi:hypothetical protein
MNTRTEKPATKRLVLDRQTLKDLRVRTGARTGAGQPPSIFVSVRTRIDCAPPPTTSI